MNWYHQLVGRWQAFVYLRRVRRLQKLAAVTGFTIFPAQRVRNMTQAARNLRVLLQSRGSKLRGKKDRRQAITLVDHISTNAVAGQQEVMTMALAMAQEIAA